MLRPRPETHTHILDGTGTSVTRRPRPLPGQPVSSVNHSLDLSCALGLGLSPTCQAHGHASLVSASRDPALDCLLKSETTAVLGACRRQPSARVLARLRTPWPRALLLCRFCTPSRSRVGGLGGPAVGLPEMRPPIQQVALLSLNRHVEPARSHLGGEGSLLCSESQ